MRPTVMGKAAVQHHKVILGEDKGIVIVERGRRRPDEIEQTVAAGRRVGAGLDVLRRPEFFSRLVVALVEQSLERFQDNPLVLLRRVASHTGPPVALVSDGTWGNRNAVYAIADN